MPLEINKKQLFGSENLTISSGHALGLILSNTLFLLEMETPFPTN